MEDRDEEIQQVFDAFDSDGSGQLSRKELGKALYSLGHFVKAQDVRRILRLSDEDGDGVLSLEEFSNLIHALDDGEDDENECPGGHKMLRRTTNPPLYGGGGALCNICSTTIAPEKGFLHCPLCQHDVCMKCIPASTSTDTICKCASGHQLPKLKSAPAEYKGCSATCDLCKAGIQYSDGFYHCKPCSYDVCNVCARKYGTTASGAKPPPSLPPAQPAPTQSSKKGIKALLVGINYPGTSAQLRGCVNDVRTMLRILEHLKLNIRESRIYVDDPAWKNSNGFPTKANIEAGMRWLTEGAMPGDSFIFHYSGHGTQVAGSTTEADGKDEALVPSDYESAGLIMDDVIKSTIVDPLPMGARLTALMDCCHSGSMFDLPYVFTASKDNITQARQGNRLTTHNPGSSPIKAEIFQISGCKDDQTSADVQSGSVAGGACTNALAEVITENANVNITDLLAGMLKSLKSSRFTQIPQLSSSQPVSADTSFKFGN